GAGSPVVIEALGRRPGMNTDQGWIDLWASGMFRACWQGALLIAAVGMAGRILPRLPAAARCWLWWLACLKLLVALAWAAPLALPVLPAPEVDRPAEGGQRPPDLPDKWAQKTSSAMAYPAVQRPVPASPDAAAAGAAETLAAPPAHGWMIGLLVLW